MINLPPDSEISVTPSTEQAIVSAIALPAAIQAALAQRPEMKQLQAHLRATNAQWEMALAGRRPQIGLHMQYDFERQSTYPDTGNWSVALVLRQPLYDGGSSKAQLAAAKSQHAELLDRSVPK